MIKEGSERKAEDTKPEDAEIEDVGELFAGLGSTEEE